MTDRHPPGEKPRGSSYESPKLQRFGDAAELTLAIGNMGQKDGGPSPMHSTST